MEKLRMGYVGCGYLAQRVHIPNILSLADCELAAIAEVRAELGKRIQEKFRIPKLYPSHRALAGDKSLQAVAVSGHYSQQGEIAIDLLDAGKDVFMEKPMAVSIEQAERILAAERRSGRRLMVGYMKRYDGGNMLVRDLVDRYRASGELGRIRFVRNHGFCGDWVAGLDTPFEQVDEPKPDFPSAWPAWLPEGFRRGYLNYLQQYTHNVNLVRWFLDAGENVQVKAVDLDENGFGGVVILEVAGVRCVIESGSVTYHAWEEHTQIYFERGWIKTWAPPLLLRNMPASVEVYKGDKERSTCQLFPPTGYTWSFKEEMKQFVECLRTDAPFRSPAQDAMADVRTLEEIYRRFTESRPG